jgi:hypothetical protein
MDWPILYQSVEAKLIDLTLGLLVSILVGIWRKRNSPYATPVLYCLGCFASLTVICYFVVSFLNLPSDPPMATTSENVEENTKLWTGNLGYSVRKIDQANNYFTLIITDIEGRGFVVRRPTQMGGRYLVIESTLTITGSDKETYDNLSDVAKEEVEEEISAEVAKQNISFGVHPPTINLNELTPISNLTENELRESINVVVNTLIIARQTFEIELKKNSPAHK